MESYDGGRCDFCSGSSAVTFRAKHDKNIAICSACIQGVFCKIMRTAALRCVTWRINDGNWDSLRSELLDFGTNESDVQDFVAGNFDDAVRYLGIASMVENMWKIEK